MDTARQWPGLGPDTFKNSSWDVTLPSRARCALFRTVTSLVSRFQRTLVRPGEAGYAREALRDANLVADLAGMSPPDKGTTTRSFQLAGGSYLAPFTRVEGINLFAFAAANLDGINHFRSLGTNTLGFEDILGGGDRDFDDGVLAFRFTQVV